MGFNAVMKASIHDFLDPTNRPIKFIKAGS